MINRKKAIMGVLCGIMVMGVGTGAALAGDKTTEAKNAQVTEAATALPEGTEPGENMDEISIKYEDGKTSYSTDGGKTWVEGLPEGAEIELNEDGQAGDVSFSVAAEAATDAEMGELLINNENGKVSHSTDGGKTWVDGMPEGTEVIFDEALDGTEVPGAEGATRQTYIKAGDGEADEYGELHIKDENGKVSHSTDGGKTWVDGPEVEFSEDITEMQELIPAV